MKKPVYSDSKRKTLDFKMMKQKDSNFTLTFVYTATA